MLLPTLQATHTFEVQLLLRPINKVGLSPSCLAHELHSHWLGWLPLETVPAPDPERALCTFKCCVDENIPPGKMASSVLGT